MSYRLRWTYAGKEGGYNLTDRDRVMLARAVHFEGPPQAAVAWTLLQRFAAVHSEGYYDSLADFVQAYAQPINPRWTRTGDLFQTRYKGLLAAGKTAEAAEEMRRAKGRESKINFPASKLKSWNLVNAILEGIVKSPVPGAIHYWASRARPEMSQEQAKVYNQAKRPNMPIVDAGVGYKPGVNVFFTSDMGKTLASVGIGDALGVGLALVAAIGGYFLYKHLRAS